MAYPRRFFVAYPAAGALGLWTVVGLRETGTMTDEPVWILAVLAGVATFAWLGWHVAMTTHGEPEIREPRRYRAALWSGIGLGMAANLYVGRRLEPDVVLWFYGLCMLSASLTFGAGVLFRRLNRQSAGVPDRAEIE